MRRLVVIALAGCYAPHPQAGAPCAAMRECPAPLVCAQATNTCEATDTPGDAPDDAMGEHVTTAPGWQARVLVELTGALPYRADDFTDGNDTVDNAPTAIAALYAPFDADFAVAAGRAILEVPDGAPIVVHDYRPASADSTGPDRLAHLVFADPPDHGPALWAAASSPRNGDGLFSFSASWKIDRDATNNNGNGIAFDPKGDFDNVGAPTIYWIDQTGILSRLAQGLSPQIFANAGEIDRLAVSKKVLYTIHEPANASTVELYGITSGSHVATPIATATDLRLVESSAGESGGVVAIRDGTELVAYARDGGATVGVTLIEPGWTFVAGSAPRAPHRHAGSFVVLESNRAADRDRLLLVTPP